MFTRLTPLLIILVFSLLTGCAYSSGTGNTGPVAAKEYLLVVQNAVDEYHADTGVLPIKNSELDTPIYEKYIIDFNRLKNQHYLSEIPKNAFEKGGTAMYVLVNAETTPTVKLMDVVLYQLANDIQQWVDTYRNERGVLPAGEQVAPQIYRLDFAKLGKKQEQAASPYSQLFLSFLVDQSGKVLVDYAPEIAIAVADQPDFIPDPQVDLRTLLVDLSPFVPIKSLPYYWIDNQPQITATAP